MLYNVGIKYILKTEEISNDKKPINVESIFRKTFQMTDEKIVVNSAMIDVRLNVRKK